MYYVEWKQSSCVWVFLKNHLAKKKKFKKNCTCQKLLESKLSSSSSSSPFRLLFCYHTAHFCTGFMALPRAQLKSEANCGMLANGPRTRKRDGEWAPVKMRNFKLSGLDFWHHTLAAPIQNNWRTLELRKKKKRNVIHYFSIWIMNNNYLYSLRPGNRCSTWSQFSWPVLWRMAYLMYARYASLIPPLSAIFSPCVLIPLIYPILKKTFKKWN